MSCLGNVIWLLFGGLAIGLYYFFMGALFCITIVGIPFGLQLFKLGKLALFPFGQHPNFGGSEMGCLSLGFNIIWVIFGGIEIAIAHLICGLLFCITVIGIPLGMQHFKLAKLALFPFGQHNN